MKKEEKTKKRFLIRMGGDRGDRLVGPREGISNKQ